jgi:hypothetical protein
MSRLATGYSFPLEKDPGIRDNPTGMEDSRQAVMDFERANPIRAG